MQEIDEQAFSILLITIAVVGGISASLAYLVYWPSMNYLAFKRRTIEGMKPEMELRVVACVIGEEDVAPLVNLLDASHPTKESRIQVFIIHLVQLVGRAAPILRANKPNSGAAPSLSDRITNAFHTFLNQTHLHGVIDFNSYTAVAPFDTMHDDICRMALNKQTSIVILPFHRDKIAGAADQGPLIQMVNRNVASYAPCSVGILIERKSSNLSAVPGQGSLRRVAVLFVGGKDDREALAYGVRMATKPSVSLTVVHFVATVVDIDEDMTQKRLDDEMIKRYNLDQNVVSVGEGMHINYRQHVVTNGVETVDEIRRMGGSYDIFLVGASRERECEVTFGMKEWGENLELGYIGDYLASSDFDGEATILVVQQQGKQKKRFGRQLGNYSLKAPLPNIRNKLFSVEVDMK